MVKAPSYQLPRSYSFKAIWKTTFPILISLVMEELLPFWVAWEKWNWEHRP